ncbi:MAG: DUF2344 domain-containing protein [Oscillospiraceae bacterium]|nr:DUF2344 domain-containing protein [Oscillospiraceae bacterium]
MEKFEVRGIFEKTGRARFISHLDLVRTMQRAMKRSKIPVWYTQGFNPRIYLNFPLALSLGVESSVEIMDFEIVEKVPFEKMCDDINRVLPEGIRFLSMSTPVCRNKEVAFAEYAMDFYAEGMNGADIGAALDRVLQQDRIEFEKHSKSKGIILVDIKPHIDIRSRNDSGDSLYLELRLPAGMDLNLNSTIFTDAFSKYSGIDFKKVSIKRTKIMKKDGTDFA